MVVRRWVLLLVAALWPCVPAVAQDAYPTRQITIVVPFAPGGSVDFIGRILAQKLSERLGRPVIVENQPGAGSATGALKAFVTPETGRWGKIVREAGLAGSQ